MRESEEPESMNSYQLQELIRNIQAMMRCPSCGAKYEADHIHFLGQLDTAALIQLDCESCSLPVMATIIVSDKGEQKTRLLSDMSADDLAEPSRDPVNSDHVVNVHTFLKGFDGDFEQLFS